MNYISVGNLFANEYLNNFVLLVVVYIFNWRYIRHSRLIHVVNLGFWVVSPLLTGESTLFYYFYLLVCVLITKNLKNARVIEIGYYLSFVILLMSSMVGDVITLMMTGKYVRNNIEFVLATNVIALIIGIGVAVWFKKILNLTNVTRAIFDKKIENITVSSIRLYMIIISGLVIVLQIYGIQQKYEIIATTVSLILIGALLSYIRKMDVIASEFVNAESLQVEYRYLQKYNVLLRNTNNQARALKHDMNNILVVAHQMAVDEEVEELTNYLDGTIKTLSQSFIGLSIWGELSKIRSVILKEILQAKVSELLQNNVTVRVSVDEGFDTILDAVDIVRIIGNVMDNALENLKTMSEQNQLIELVLLNTNRGNSIIISNVVDSKVDSTKILAKGYTTKKNHEGQGLVNVQKIFSAYPNSSFSISTKAGRFTIKMNNI
ncbi:GHKL domain-containing protein [Periweissella cryptocerci]|uniref:GHKL domain-containing protein n=1 Tax=Periweissella cryptocerci TaxID=2506420 RepID=A0A4P6YTY6_9LACO|nr:GHKL domain-containing protein [Periweissella cryptocerci]QBO36172.1 GHKL domain-containing protein [Periweissella cryptocerci]